MATSATSPSSPLQAEDLLSESSEPPGLNQVSSEVTSQLYTSLHLSRQAEATARAQLYLASASPPPHEALDGLAQELSRSLSVGLENNLKKKDGSKHIFEMESVRGQLQTMLQTSRDAAYPLGSLGLSVGDPLTAGAGLDKREEESFDSDSTATLLNTRLLQDLSPSSSAQALEELFPRYTRLHPGLPINPPDFQGLRDALDSEHARRKTVTRLEQSLSEAIEALNREQESARLQQQEREALEEERQALTLSLEVEQQRNHALQKERDEARAGQLSEHRKLETLQVALEEERQAWAQQEHQLKEHYKTMQEEGQAQLEREKGNSQRETQAAREAQQQLALVHSEVRRLEGELDTARRERDALQLEMSLVQARFETQRIQMESELAVQLEQQVTERLAQAQESSLRQTASLRENHRKQLQDLNGQHQQELATQLAQFKVEMAEREERQQQVAQDYELRLAREQARVRDLQSGNQQLEEQRMEMVERLQTMLQAHWEEVNQLLSTLLPPPNHPVHPTGPSSSNLSEPEKGERRTWTMPPVAVALKPVLQQSREAREEPPGVPPVDSSHSPDLSLLLGPSFQSQHSFQPLEPKPDLTPPIAEDFSTLETFHPDQRAERLLPEENPVSEGDGFLKQGLPPVSQLEGLKNFLQQLLETVPQNSESPSVDLLPTKCGPRTVPSWEESFQVPRLPPPVHKTKVPLAMASNLFRVHEFPSSCSQGNGPSTGSPEKGADGLSSSRQLMEVSQLLRQYQARGWETLPAEDLLLYLKRLEHGGTDSRGDSVPRRNPDSRLGEIARKEIPSQAVPRRLAAAPKTEKPPARKKSSHPAPSSMRARGGIWR
ncbi:centrobin isoform X5 [Octodon degus]|uniref:Centrobin isoform X5 n=1 Tax=Octodon degus TaxID=10160 RepID=A0A6P6F376_OCTDE|nr:centrobin isoform X5 [Octodon degus]